MKLKYADKARCRSILSDCLIFRDDRGYYPCYFELAHDQVLMIVDVAGEWGYRKPKNANGSRGRYFYDALVKKAWL